MISVVIPTFNRAKLLEATLQSLQHQTLSPTEFEILVIDNGSTDNTLEVARKFQSVFTRLRYILEKEPGLHSGRHRGMNEANGDILVYADDDIKAFPTWLEGITESFQDERTGIVGGKNLPDYESEPPEWIDELWVTTPEGKYMTYFSLLDFGDEVKEVHPHFVFGCNFSIRKQLLMEVKGFHPDGMPASSIKLRGDGESHTASMVQRLGYATIFNPKASVNHWVPASRMNIEYVKKRAFSEGITQSYIDTREKMKDHSVETTALIKHLKKIKPDIRSLFTSKLEKEIRRSFKEGYDFHQSELKRDKTLLQWVLKDNYLS